MHGFLTTESNEITEPIHTSVFFTMPFNTGGDNAGNRESFSGQICC